MTAFVGHVALWTAVVLAAAGFALAVVGTRRSDRRGVNAGRWALALAALGLCAAWSALVVGQAGNDLTLVYVAAHSAAGLSLPTRIASAWSGQEGSLLLWATLSGVACAVAAGRTRLSSVRGRGAATAAGLAIAGSLAGVALFAADPFVTQAMPRTTAGRGLDPSLLHWAMLVHPPLLFAGYAGLAAAFALFVGAGAGGRRERAWASDVRRWTGAAWVALTAGITLGAWWSYRQVGWGGYWAWDPVENASLLPWLAATAGVHTLAARERRGLLAGWAAVLPPLAFGLVLLAAFVTRSGAVASVHAFARSSIGGVLLGLLAAQAWASARVVLTSPALTRGRIGRGGQAGRGAARWWSREGVTAAGNAVLVLMVGVTAVGTLFPIVVGGSESGAGGTIGVSPEFFARTVAPLGVLIAALAAVGPWLPPDGVERSGTPTELKLGALGSLVTVAAAALAGVWSVVALGCAGIAAFVLVSGAAGVARDLRIVRGVPDDDKGDAGGVGGVRGVLRPLLIAAVEHRRRWGGRLAHAGYAVLVAAVCASGVYGSTTTSAMRVGDEIRAGRWTIRLDGVRNTGPEGRSATAELTASAGRAVRRLAPSRERIDDDRALSRTALAAGAVDDVVIALAGVDRRGPNGGEGAGGSGVAAVQVRVVPMGSWIWVGAGMIVAGGVPALSARGAMRGTARGAMWGAGPRVDGDRDDVTNAVPTTRSVPAAETVHGPAEIQP